MALCDEITWPATYARSPAEAYIQTYDEVPETFFNTSKGHQDLGAILLQYKNFTTQQNDGAISGTLMFKQTKNSVGVFLLQANKTSQLNVPSDLRDIQ